MSKNTQWKVGAVYRTKGGLCAEILRENKLAVPSELSAEEKEFIRSKPFYAYEGYIYLEHDPKNRSRGSWTALGKHTLENPGVTCGDLTKENITKLFKDSTK